MAMIDCPECEKPISDKAPSCPNCGVMMSSYGGKNGWVYILSNEGMPGLIKVGFTEKDPTGRANELNTTGVPYPFIVEYGILLKDAYTAEQSIHEELESHRVETGKEFFKCSVDESISTIREKLGNEILLEGRCFKSNTEEEIKSEISFPLIGLIDSLKEDSELTNHEIDSLAEWLQANPDACDIWPGTKLVEPLKEFYEDGVLSEDELKLIFKLFQEIDEQYKKMFKWDEPKVSETEASAEGCNVEYDALRQRIKERITIEKKGFNISDQHGPPAEN